MYEYCHICQAEERLQEQMKNLEADLAREKVRWEEERKALLGRIDDQGRSGSAQVGDTTNIDRASNPF